MAPALNSNTVWFITGCSPGGLGESLVKQVHSAGHNVVATARNASSLTYIPDGPKVLKLSLDVTSPSSIISALEATLARFSRLDVVINNAGYGSMGEAEGYPEEMAREVLETNFWGAARITQESVRIFREKNEGRGGTVVQVSSMGGFMTAAGNSFYNASKFALEGFTKAMQKELPPAWNVDLLLLSPGGINTRFVNNAKLAPRLSVYKDSPDSPMNAILSYLETPGVADTWANPDKCASTLFQVLSGKNERALPTRLNLGGDAFMLVKAEAEAILKETVEWEAEALSVTASGEGGNMSTKEFWVKK